VFLIENPYKKRKRSKHSVITKLRKENKSNKDFEIFINKLTLEELIALKLELAAKRTRGKMYGFPFWKAAKSIMEDALMRFALSIFTDQKEIMMYLGITKTELKRAMKKYRPDKYFQSKTDSGGETVEEKIL